MLVSPCQRLRRLGRDDVGPLHRLKDAGGRGLGDELIGLADGSFALVAEGVGNAGDDVLVRPVNPRRAGSSRRLTMASGVAAAASLAELEKVLKEPGGREGEVRQRGARTLRSTPKSYANKVTHLNESTYPAVRIPGAGPVTFRSHSRCVV